VFGEHLQGRRTSVETGLTECKRNAGRITA
jgi:hypothetical protein